MRRISLLFTALLVVAGCQTETAETPAPAGDQAAPASTSRDVCAMMTMEELNTAAGLTSAPGMSSTSGGAEVCTWTGEEGKSVIVQVFPSSASYEQARQAFQSLYGGTAEDVTAVGEKAFFIAGNTGSVPTGTLVAQQGSTPVSVQVMGGTGDAATRRAEATAVAHVILSKL